LKEAARISFEYIESLKLDVGMTGRSITFELSNEECETLKRWKLSEVGNGFDQDMMIKFKAHENFARR